MVSIEDCKNWRIYFDVCNAGINEQKRARQAAGVYVFVAITRRIRVDLFFFSFPSSALSSYSLVNREMRKCLDFERRTEVSSEGGKRTNVANPENACFG